jgi:hypothetical protein
LCGNNGNAFFGAFSIGGAPFYFIEFEEDKQNEKDHFFNANNGFDIILRHRSYRMFISRR